MDLERAGKKLKAHFRRLEQHFPMPVRRELFFRSGRAGPIPLPRMPWAVDAKDPDDPVPVLEVDGAFEPARRVRVYGPNDPVARFIRRERSPRLRIRRLHDVVLLPRSVMLSPATGALLPASFNLFDDPKLLPSDPQRPGRRFHSFEGEIFPPKIVEEPLFLADATHQAFGHTLIETVPMLEMSRLMPQVRLATSALVHEAMFEAMREGSSADAFRVRGPTLCRTLYVPDAPVDVSGNLHSVGRQAFARLGQLGATSTVAPRPRLYISRSRVRERPLQNEREIEALFASFGFDIVHPQLLPFADQVRLAQSAEMVAGPGGSGMHLMVFARPETKALVLSSPYWYVDLDQYIAQRDDQFGVVIGSARPSPPGDHNRVFPWTVDKALVAAAIGEHFGL